MRWQLTRNQWARSRYGVRGIFAGIIAIAACVLGAVSFLGGLFVAVFGLADVSANVVMTVFLALTAFFLMFWTIGLLVELQRSETIDLHRLMHLPVVLRQIFLINYLASHFALSIVVTVPAMVGLSIGLAIGRGPMMLLILPLALSMIFMVTAWTYCFRGWLAAMMTNPRRRRTIIMLVTLAIVAIAQLPNLYFNVLGQAHPRNPTTLPGDIKNFWPPKNLFRHFGFRWVRALWRKEIPGRLYWERSDVRPSALSGSAALIGAL